MDDDWLARSNAYARRALAVDRRIEPERLSSLGDAEADAEIFQLPPDRGEQEIAMVEELVAGLRRALDGERHPQVGSDLELLIANYERELAHRRLEDQMLLPYVNLPQAIFNGLHVLLSERVDPRRRQAACVRLRRYAGREEGYQPLAEQFVTLLRSRLDRPGLLFPPRPAVARDLETTASYLAAMSEGLRALGLCGWEEDHARLAQQLAESDAFVRTHVLPRARPDFRLPPELYASHLKRNGVEMPIDELVGRARVELHATRLRLRRLAQRWIPQSTARTTADYREIVRRLTMQAPPAEGIVALLRRRVREVREAIERHGLLTLPELGVRVVRASEAESARMPFPHLVVPPLLGPFRAAAIDLVVPVAGPGNGPRASLVDYRSQAGAWTVAVHEMGHAVQLAVVAGGRLPLARLGFFTMSDVEGWAVYLESELLPHLPPAGQILALHFHLLRCARTIFEPDLHLGKLTPEEVVRILGAGVVFSTAQAGQELERFQILPGQTASYLHGHFRHAELRADTELALGPRFRSCEYHDFILRQGLIPPPLLCRRIRDQLMAGALFDNATNRLPEPG